MEGRLTATVARLRCAARTREEMLTFSAPRPLSARDELRIRWQQERCGTCTACPLVIRALAIMLPAVEPVSGIILKLAG